ncbi:MAG: LytTR family DNA-binding domain-containing protein [Treponema sp.]|jgi:DNA-binding LytR/AlgR family response regulator|nr:LytTR family DNA-binding domain-containing protein [Treponema sp.]
MTQILICDDHFADLQSLASIIDDYYKGSYPSDLNDDREHANSVCAFSLTKFTDPKEVLAYIEDGNKADIAILDIMMPQMNGMDLAAKMREMGFNGYLLFLSLSNDFAVQSYNVKAFSYILKPAQEQKVFELLSSIERTRGINDRSGFMLSFKGVMRLVTYSELMYVEVKSHQLYFHLIDGEIIIIYAALKDYSEKLLSQSHNIRPHKSFIVNLD